MEQAAPTEEKIKLCDVYIPILIAEPHASLKARELGKEYYTCYNSRAACVRRTDTGEEVCFVSELDYSIDRK